MSQAKLDVIPLFYIPLVHIVLDEDTDELKTCNEYLTSAVQSDTVNIGNEYVENYRRLEQFPKTKDILTRVCNSTIKNILKYDSEFSITTSWLTKHKKGEECQLHNHKNCMFSAVYYYGDYDEKSAPITFKNPLPDLSTYMVNPNGKNPFNIPFMEMSPQKGSLIIFPSYLFHSVLPNNSDIDRLSLAFNLIPTGMYGGADSSCDSNWFIN